MLRGFILYSEFRKLGIQQNETPISQYFSDYSYILINFPNSINFFQRLLIFAGFRHRIQMCHSGQLVSGPLRRPIPHCCRSCSNLLLFFSNPINYFLRLLVFSSFRQEILALRSIFGQIAIFWPSKNFKNLKKILVSFKSKLLFPGIALFKLRKCNVSQHDLHFSRNNGCLKSLDACYRCAVPNNNSKHTKDLLQQAVQSLFVITVGLHHGT